MRLRAPRERSTRRGRGGGLGPAVVLAGASLSAYEGLMFLGEMGLGVLLPILVLAWPRLRASQLGLAAGAFLAVLGFVVHRLNVSITGTERSAGVAYLPSWVEVAVTVGLEAGGFVVFRLAVQYLPIVPSTPRETASGPPAWDAAG